MTPIVKPIAVFFTIEINEFPRAGNAATNACGSMTSVYVRNELSPIDKAASFCPLSTASNPPLMISAIKAAEFIADKAKKTKAKKAATKKTTTKAVEADAAEEKKTTKKASTTTKKATTAKKTTKAADGEEKPAKKEEK